MSESCSQKTKETYYLGLIKPKYIQLTTVKVKYSHLRNWSH